MMTIPQEGFDAVTSPDEGISWSDLKIFNIICVAVFTLVGTVGNIFIIGAILLEKQLKYLGNAFIINLAIFDLLITGYGFPTIFANITAERSAMPRIGCIFTALVVMYSVTGSLLNMTFIALDRYLAVCFNNLHKRFFKRPLVVCLLLFTWIHPFIIASPAILYDDLDYDSRNQLCLIKYKTSPMWYSIFYITVVVMFPMMVCAYFYLLIFLTVRRSKQRVGTKKSDNSIYKTLFTVFALFVASWTPIATGVVLNTIGINIPDEMYRWFTYLGMANSIINGFIYGFSNKHFRKGYIKFLQYIACNLKIYDRNKIFPVTSLGQSTIQD